MRSFPLVAFAFAAALQAGPALADPPPAAPPAVAAPPTQASPPPPAPPPPPPPAPEKKHGSRAPGALVLALGGAGLVAGTIFGAAATAEGASVRSQCVANVCPAVTGPAVSETKNFVAASYAAFVAGGIFAVTGLVLVIVAPGPPVADDAPKSARIAPWVGPGGGGLTITGSF